MFAHPSPLCGFRPVHPETGAQACPLSRKGRTLLTTPTGSSPAPAAGRSGYLYRKVALYLCDHPDEILKTGEITRALAVPSSGAVAEVLKKMTAAGHVTHHPNPHRYQITQAGVDAAGTLPPATGGPRTGSGRSRAGRPASIVRPGGQTYYPRRLGGGWDVEVLRTLRRQQVPVLLYGPPGTGKTAMLEAAFPDLLTVAGTGDTIVDDFLGSYAPLPGGGYDFVYGPLVVAMREGGRCWSTTPPSSRPACSPCSTR